MQRKNKDFEGWNGNKWFSLITGLNRGSITIVGGFEDEAIPIVDQEWTAENLYSGHFRNGDSVI